MGSFFGGGGGSQIIQAVQAASGPGPATASAGRSSDSKIATRNADRARQIAGAASAARGRGTILADAIGDLGASTDNVKTILGG